MNKYAIAGLVLIAGFLGWYFYPQTEEVLFGSASGPNNPDVGTQDTAVGTFAWGSNTNLISSNDSYDASGGTGLTHYLVGTDFDFALPANSTVVGVEVGIEGKTGFDGSAAEDNSVKLVVGGAVSGDDKSSGTAWTSSDTTHSFGGTSDTWGLSLTETEVNATDFGVAYSCNMTINSTGADCFVDTMTITLTYIETAASNEITLKTGSIKIGGGTGGRLNAQ